MNNRELRAKYPKWAHRRDARKKRRRRSRRRRRRSRRRRGADSARRGADSATEVMRVQLLSQLLAPQAVSRKHGTNVVTGYGGSVNPDSLAPVATFTTKTPRKPTKRKKK